jgi:hypothetical protein
MIHSFNDIILKVGGGATYTSDFNAGKDGWSAASSSHFENHVGGGPTDDPGNGPGSIHYRADTGAGTHYMERNIFTAGKKYRVSGKVYINGTNPILDAVRVTLGKNQYDLVILDTITDHDQWVSFEVEFTADGASGTNGNEILVFFGLTSALGYNWASAGTIPYDDFYIADIVVRELGEEIYASSADISSRVEIGGRNNVGVRDSSNYFSQSPADGEVSITYYITGEDPIANLINDSSPSRLEVGGFHVNSGYLSKYEFQLSQYNPITVNASFNFFEKVKGAFEKKDSTLANDQYFLTSADLTLSDEVAISTGDLRSLNYSYSNNVIPNYVVEEGATLDEVALKGVVEQGKKFDISSNLYSSDMNLPASGVASALSINLNDKHGNKKIQFEVNGVIHQKGFNSPAGGQAMQKLSIAQGNFGGKVASLNSPAIAETTAMPGDSLSIFGSDMQDVDKVSFMGFRCEITSKNSTSVQIIVPYSVPNSGASPFVVRSPAGETATTETLMISGAGTLDLF